MFLIETIIINNINTDHIIHGIDMNIFFNQKENKAQYNDKNY